VESPGKSPGSCVDNPALYIRFRRKSSTELRALFLIFHFFLVFLDAQPRYSKYIGQGPTDSYIGFRFSVVFLGSSFLVSAAGMQYVIEIKMIRNALHQAFRKITDIRIQFIGRGLRASPLRT